MVYLTMLRVGVEGFKDKDLLFADEFEGGDEEVVARQAEHRTRPLKRFKGSVCKQLARESSQHDQFNLRAFPRSSMFSQPH